MTQGITTQNYSTGVGTSSSRRPSTTVMPRSENFHSIHSNLIISNSFPNRMGDELQPTSDIASVQCWRLARKRSTPPRCTSWARNQHPPPSKLFLYTKHLHSSTTSLRDSHPRCTSRLHTREPTQKHKGTPGRADKKPNRRERSGREH